MVRVGFLAVILMGLVAGMALAGDIVVLTETPVAAQLAGVDDHA